jgi:hypothetical protein
VETKATKATEADGGHSLVRTFGAPAVAKRGLIAHLNPLVPSFSSQIPVPYAREPTIAATYSRFSSSRLSPVDFSQESATCSRKQALFRDPTSRHGLSYGVAYLIDCRLAIVFPLFTRELVNSVTIRYLHSLLLLYQSPL